MFRNQYFVTNYKTDSDLGFRTHEFGDLIVHSCPALPASWAREETRDAAILGFAIDPLEPERGGDDIASSLARARDAEEVMLRTQGLSGRYVVLYRTGDAAIAFSDALGHRQIYYHGDGERLFLTSSPKLFVHVLDGDAQISEEKRAIIGSEAFRRNQNAWFGDRSLDDRLRKVLPNHYLDLTERRVRRKVFAVSRPDSESGLRGLCGRLLAGGIAGAVRRYKVMQPVTAGMDSRLLLAASRDCKDEIQYYIFRRPNMGDDHPDVAVPLRLSKKIGIDFRPIATEPLRDEFTEAYKFEHIAPRILPKTQNIQYHYYNSREVGNILDVKGNGAEVMRFFYGRMPSLLYNKVNTDMLAYFARYPDCEYFSRQIDNWLSEASGFARHHRIPLPDLFYWEQRMGNWGADHGLEQDIAIEEFWPFNNATLLFSGLSVDESQRTWPRYRFFKALMKDLWPEVLSEPINPKSGSARALGYYLNGWIRSNAYLEYLAKKAMHGVNRTR